MKLSVFFSAFFWCLILAPTSYAANIILATHNHLTVFKPFSKTSSDTLFLDFAGGKDATQGKGGLVVTHQHCYGEFLNSDGDNFSSSKKITVFPGTMEVTEEFRRINLGVPSFTVKTLATIDKGTPQEISIKFYCMGYGRFTEMDVLLQIAGHIKP